MADLESRLAARDIDLDSLLVSHGIDSRAHGVLVVGSLAEGIGTPSSDLDLMILLDSGEIDFPAEAMALRTKFALEFLSYEHGIEVNGEALTRSALADALRAFLDLAPTLYDMDNAADLPIIDPTERQLLHRLLSGWPLRGLDVVERWRDESLVVMFPPYLALLQFILYREYLEDVTAVRDTDDGSFSLVARESASAALFCLLALNGITNPQQRWLVRLAAKVGHCTDARLVDELLELLFLPAKLTLAERDATLARLTSAGECLRRRLDEDRELGLAAAAVADRIHYTNDADGT